MRGRLGARGCAVVAQPEHHQRIAEAGEAQTDAPLGARLVVLLRQRPHGGVEHVVEHAHRDLHHVDEGVVAKARARLERRVDEEREVDRAEAAAAVGGQRLLAARVGRIDALAIAEVVVGVDAVDEQHAGLGVVVGRAHDLVPQVARARPPVHPQAVGAPRARRPPFAPRSARRGAPARSRGLRSTARMKASVTPTEMLKLVSSPPSLAWMNSSTSGWSQRSTPICAPRRLPADSTVSHDWSNTRM